LKEGATVPELESKDVKLKELLERTPKKVVECLLAEITDDDVGFAKNLGLFLTVFL
jgi:hypothetical protein